jgi:DNA repair protein RecN (Recombination protein N)
MLESLRIQNLALVTRADLNFGSGLTAVTGESGSGKSILLDALALVTGCARPRIRARTGCASGFVEGQFRPARNEGGKLSSAELEAVLREQGLVDVAEDADEPLILARRVDASGRTRCFIQGQTVSRQVLATIGRALLELCGQSEAHNLRTPAAQLAALDRFARLCEKQRKLERTVADLRHLEARADEVQRRADEAERRRDFLEFQLAELRECDLNDLDERRKRLDSLTEATKDLESHAQLLSCLVESDGAVIPQLRFLSARMGSKGSGNMAGCLSDAIATLDRVVDELEELSHGSTVALSESDRDREEAEELRREFSNLWSLAQKHRVSVDELPSRQGQLERELSDSIELDADLRDLRAQLHATRAAARKEAEKLHAARKKAAALLDKRMKEELAGVGLGSAHFETHLSRGDLTSTGITHLDFGFSANPGHEPQPLSRVASGGELSRVLLCFRLATEYAGAMLVFDEIDAGAGGKTAEKIAASLRRASCSSQVLCVTHWPQVAGVADAQLAVQKHISGDSTQTDVVEVRGEQRLQELSRMLGGEEKTARQHACRLVARGDQAA